jgi:hypothetical protein
MARRAPYGAISRQRQRVAGSPPVGGSPPASGSPPAAGSPAVGPGGAVGNEADPTAIRPSLVSGPPTGPAIRRRRVVQGKRVRRVIRRFDTWTVLKLSFLFYLCICLVLLIAGVLLWNIASAFNVITNVEKFIRSLLDLATFKLQPGVVFEASLVGGVLLVLLGTGVNVLVALLYNLISDVVGGVQVIVLEEQEEP